MYGDYNEKLVARVVAWLLSIGSQNYNTRMETVMFNLGRKERVINEIWEMQTFKVEMFGVVVWGW